MFPSSFLILDILLHFPVQNPLRNTHSPLVDVALKNELHKEDVPRNIILVEITNMPAFHHCVQSVCEWNQQKFKGSMFA